MRLQSTCPATQPKPSNNPGNPPSDSSRPLDLYRDRATLSGDRQTEDNPRSASSCHRGRTRVGQADIIVLRRGLRRHRMRAGVQVTPGQIPLDMPPTPARVDPWPHAGPWRRCRRPGAYRPGSSGHGGRPGAARWPASMPDPGSARRPWRYRVGVRDRDARTGFGSGHATRCRRGADVAVGEAAQDLERAVGGQRGSSGQRLADRFDDRFVDVEDVADGPVLDLAAFAQGSSRQTGLADASLLATHCGGDVDGAVSWRHALKNSVLAILPTRCATASALFTANKRLFPKTFRRNQRVTGIPVPELRRKFDQAFANLHGLVGQSHPVA